MHNTLESVRKQIASADHSYYTLGRSVVDDAVYDCWKDTLKKSAPSDPLLHRVGSPIADSILTKRKHSIPMGSQNKASNKDEYYEWVNKLENPNCRLHASYKMDGGSISLEYNSGILVRAITRGDGIEGEDITANALKFKNLPKQRPSALSGYVRAEVVLRLDDWELVDPELESNPRNLAVGISRRKDSSQSEFLSVFAFQVCDTEGKLISDTETKQINTLSSCGFTAVTDYLGTADEIWKWFEKLTSMRAELPFWIDGIVVKVDNIADQLEMGESSNRPKGQVAVKFESESAATTLRGVTYQVGQTGTITPVANFDTIILGGANVSNATLCNWDNIAALGIAIGDEIRVAKAGDIIPKVIEVLKEGKTRMHIVRPITCPICGTPTSKKQNVSGDDSSAIFCTNDNCHARIVGKLTHYLAKVNILGVGDSIVETLVQEGIIRKVSDLYTLKNRLNTLSNLQISGKVRLGEKRAQKIIEEIEGKRDLTLSEFIGSLGLPGLGRRRVKLIQKAAPGKFDTLSDWLNDKILTYAVQVGVPNLALAIVAGLKDNHDLIIECINAGVRIKPDVAVGTGKLFCITGSLSVPKKEWQLKIASKGYRYTDTFSKDVDYLIAADPSSGSTKLQKAVKMGTRILSEADLAHLLSS